MFYIRILATQWLYLDRNTESTIVVSYTAEAGVTGSHIVARNSKLGHFEGTCDADSGTCTVSGLSAGFIYDIWVRTCDAKGPKSCILRAMPAQIVTYPKRT